MTHVGFCYTSTSFGILTQAQFSLVAYLNNEGDVNGVGLI